MADGNLSVIFREHLPVIMWTRIESGLTGRGIPDLHGCCSGSAFWIENKKTKTNAVDLRPEQVGWLLSYRRHGGRAFVAIRRKRDTSARRDACDELYIFDGAYAAQLKRLGLTGAAPAVMGEGGPARWPWDRVKTKLLG